MMPRRRSARSRVRTIRPRVFEVVQHAHQVRRVDAQQVGQRLLGGGAALAQVLQRQQLTRAQPDGSDRLLDARSQAAAELCDQHAGGGRGQHGSVGFHTSSVQGQIVYASQMIGARLTLCPTTVPRSRCDLHPSRTGHGQPRLRTAGRRRATGAHRRGAAAARLPGDDRRERRPGPAAGAGRAARGRGGAHRPLGDAAADRADRCARELWPLRPDAAAAEAARPRDAGARDAKAGRSPGLRDRKRRGDHRRRPDRGRVGVGQPAGGVRLRGRDT